MQIEMKLRPMPHQRELLLWKPPAHAPAGPIVQAVLGGWGSAKTTAVAMQFAITALSYGWHSAYGRKRPQAIVVAPNLRLARKNQLELIDSMLPADLVKRRWSMPEPRILLANGLEITAISADANYEGENLVMCWLDEIQHELYSSNPERYTNYIARLRDPLARQKHTRMFVSGLPTSGWVRDQFEDKGDDPAKNTRLWGSRLNTKLASGVFDQIRRATPAGQEATFLEGQWQPLPGALFPQFDVSRNILGQEINLRAPVSVGIDIGNHAAIVIGQRHPNEALHIVDEILGVGQSMEEMVYQLKQKGYLIQPGKSEIYVDPTLRRDEINAIRKHFPGVHLVQRERSDQYHDVWTGIRVVQSALRSAAGTTKLTFASSLKKNPKGVIEAMERLRVNQRTGSIVVDDQRDHAADALRYLCCGVLGRKPGTPEVS